MEIRPAEEIDLPALVASSTGLFAEDAGTRDSTMNIQWPQQHGLRSFVSALEDPARLVLVADAGDRIAGHLSGVLEEPTSVRPIRIANLSSVFVYPEFRGDGIGKQLLEVFTRWAAEHEAVRLSVTAYASNAGAIRFYERHGFTAHIVTLEHELG